MYRRLEKLAGGIWHNLGEGGRSHVLKVKEYFPTNLRKAVSAAIKSDALRDAIARIIAGSDAEIPSREALAALREGWGNEGYSASIEYLEEVARRGLRAYGPVLECGSGLTTILLGIVAGRRGVPVWTLEHDSSWKARVDTVLRVNAVLGVEISLSPLAEYGSFTWYSVLFDRIPDKFHLVVCDGPPQITTKGGRYGLLPVMENRLARGCIILMDDADPQAPTIERWQREFDVGVESIDVQSLDNRGMKRDFAVIQVR